MNKLLKLFLPIATATGTTTCTLALLISTKKQLEKNKEEDKVLENLELKINEFKEEKLDYPQEEEEQIKEKQEIKKEDKKIEKTPPTIEQVQQTLSNVEKIIHDEMKKREGGQEVNEMKIKVEEEVGIKAQDGEKVKQEERGEIDAIQSTEVKESEAVNQVREENTISGENIQQSAISEEETAPSMAEKDKVDSISEGDPLAIDQSLTNGNPDEKESEISLPDRDTSKGDKEVSLTDQNEAVAKDNDEESSKITEKALEEYIALGQKMNNKLQILQELLKQ